MEVTLLGEKRALLVRVFGELDHHSARAAREKTDMMINCGVYDRLILDFTGLTFMDSSGISFIMGRVKLLAPLGGRVTVITSEEKISRIIIVLPKNTIFISEK